MLPEPSSLPFRTRSYPFERTSHGADSSFSRSSSTMPVKGCCALTHVLSDSLHSKSGNPVSHRNFHWDLSITPSASPSCSRNCPAMSADASVPLICSFAETATTRSPGFAPFASASFFTFSSPISFSTVDVSPSGATLTKYAPRARSLGGVGRGVLRRVVAGILAEATFCRGGGGACRGAYAQKLGEGRGLGKRGFVTLLVRGRGS